MSWLLVALLSAATFAMVSVLDKLLIDRYFRQVAPLNLALGVISIIIGVALWGVVRPPVGDSPAGVTWGLASGFIWGLGILCQFFALRREEVSRVIPVYNTSPIFVLILAVAFLGERLTLGQGLAILVTVSGAILISLRHAAGLGRVVRLGPVFWLTILGAVLTALGMSGNKLALRDLDVLETLAVRNIGMGVAFLYFLKAPVVKALLAGMRHAPTAVTLVLAEVVLAPLAAFLTVWAISLGPVSLVSAASSVRPLFVFAYSATLSMPFIGLLNESLSQGTLTLKFVATTLVVLGIIGLSVL